MTPIIKVYQFEKNDYQIAKEIEESVNKAESKLEKRLETSIEAQVAKKVDEKENKLEKQAERHLGSMNKLFDENKDSFRWLFDRATWIIGILVSLMAILTGIGMFIFGGQKRSLKELLTEQEQAFRKEIDALTAKLENRIKGIDQNALEKISELQDKLTSLDIFKHKQIIWYYENDKTDASEEIGEIRKQGFSVSEIKPGQENTIAQDKCDFVIYSFCKSDKSVERITDLVKFLKSTGRNVPCIIYTYNAGDPKTLTDENKILKEYRNYVMANMPLTLKSQFNSLIRL